MTVHLVDPSGRRVARAGSRAAAHRQARRGKHVGSHLRVVRNRTSPELRSFNVGDGVVVASGKSKGLSGVVTYVGSGPHGDKVSVRLDHPVQAMLGPAILDPKSLRHADANRASWGGRTVFPREFYVPKEARGKTPITIEDLEIYLYETGTGAYGAVVFAGKAQKPLWNYIYKTEKARDQKIADTIASRRRVRKSKVEKKAEAKAYRHDFKVGDVVSTSWGYDQTQVQYFQVVEVRGADLIVREIAQRNVGGGGQGSDRVVAVPGDFIGKPIRVRPQPSGGLKVEGHYASKWSGSPQYQTASGYGH